MRVCVAEQEKRRRTEERKATAALTAASCGKPGIEALDALEV
jgi:hypothetical protein